MGGGAKRAGIPTSLEQGDNHATLRNATLIEEGKLDGPDRAEVASSIALVRMGRRARPCNVKMPRELSLTIPARVHRRAETPCNMILEARPSGALGTT